MQLLYAQKARRLFWSLPALSTVYIKARCVVDALAGLLTAPFLYKLGGCLWRKMSKK
jgi:hypothetical protein